MKTLWQQLTNLFRVIVHGMSRAVAAFLIGLVRCYQWLLRPLLPLNLCRFQPTCSEYFIAAVRKYGPLWGTLKGLWRLCRCHPWGGYGYDPP
ncbi:MAG: membrane protein insertion efficiency factor YidD [Gemmataceae bacterium]|nr:membrane protein insertion efficiency factor YidD [Gemmataceae bacterium]MDW8242496.1 membrane protein insertion efficiency factor YidD [Thermogemmata sp.]